MAGGHSSKQPDVARLGCTGLGVGEQRLRGLGSPGVPPELSSPLLRLLAVSSWESRGTGAPWSHGSVVALILPSLESNPF